MVCERFRGGAKSASDCLGPLWIGLSLDGEETHLKRFGIADQSGSVGISYFCNNLIQGEGVEGRFN